MRQERTGEIEKTGETGDTGDTLRDRRDRGPRRYTRDRRGQLVERGNKNVTGLSESYL